MVFREWRFPHQNNAAREKGLTLMFILGIYLKNLRLFLKNKFNNFQSKNINLQAIGIFDKKKQLLAYTPNLNKSLG